MAAAASPGFAAGLASGAAKLATLGVGAAVVPRAAVRPRLAASRLLNGEAASQFLSC